MKKIILLLVFAMMSATGAIGAEKPLGVEEYTSVDELASAISSYFPKIQGEVTDVQGGQITIALGAKEGLQTGVTLTVWRDGKEILHPVTGAVLGRAEEEVGSVEVTAVRETTSIGSMLKKIKDPKPGDKARITPKKITIALIPLRADRPEIVQGLADRLNEYGRFSVLDKEKTAAFLQERKERDSSLIKEMGRNLKLDVVAAIGVYPSDTRFLVTARLFYAEDGRLLDTIVAMLDLKTKKDVLGEVKPFFAPAHEEASGIAELPFDAQLFAAADLDGSNTLQYVLSDGAKLHIYKQGPTGWREVWTETVPYTAAEMQHINLDVADINGNGRPEIIVTGMLNGKVISFVMESRDGVYRRIAELPGFLRVVNAPHKGNILIGQGYDPVSFYAGRPKQYTWSDGKYVPGTEFPLPKGLGLYSFVYADFGEPNPLLVALDTKDQLLVYSNDVLIWRSEEQYPSVGVTVTRPVTGIDEMFARAATEGDKSQKVKIRGRVLVLDMNGDGRDEIFLPKNGGATLLTGYKESELVGLGWTGARLEQRWSVKDIPGAILDFQMFRQEGPGAQIPMLVMTPGGVFGKDRMRVMTYSVK